MTRVLAVLVLYGQKLEESHTWNTLYADSPEWLTWAVYNNGPLPIEPPKSVRYHENLSNGGISAAYSWGSELLAETGCEYILLLDQDSSFPPDFLEKLQQAVRSKSAHCVLPTAVSQFGYKMSPNLWLFQRGWQYKKNRLPRSYSFIGSGTAISAELFREIWDEPGKRLFLDHVDHYLAFQMRKRKIVPALLDSQFIQDYSAESTDREKVRIRHEIWKRDVLVFAEIAHCQLIMRFWILYISLRKMIRLRDPFLFR